MSVFFFFLSFSFPLLVRNRGGSLTCQQRGVLFCKPCTHFFLPAITLFTPATIHKEHRRFQNFSVTFSEIIMKKKRISTNCYTPLPTKKEKKNVVQSVEHLYWTSQTLSVFLMCVNVGPVTAPSLTCPPQRYLGTPSQALSVGKRGDTPDTSPRSTPLLPLNTSSTSMATCLKKLLHSVPHTATYKKEFSLSLLSRQLSFSLLSSLFLCWHL